MTRYRRYSASSSRDGARMLSSVRTVYARQWQYVRGRPDADAAFHSGLEQLSSIFLDCLVENVEDRLAGGDRERALQSARVLALESPERWQTLAAGSGDAASLAADLPAGLPLASPSEEDGLRRSPTG